MFQSLSRDSWWSHSTHAPGKMPHYGPSKLGRINFVSHKTPTTAPKTIAFLHSFAHGIPLLCALRALVPRSSFRPSDFGLFALTTYMLPHPHTDLLYLVLSFPFYPASASPVLQGCFTARIPTGLKKSQPPLVLRSRKRPAPPVWATRWSRPWLHTPHTEGRNARCPPPASRACPTCPAK